MPGRLRVPASWDSCSGIAKRRNATSPGRPAPPGQGRSAGGGGAGVPVRLDVAAMTAGGVDGEPPSPTGLELAADRLLDDAEQVAGRVAYRAVAAACIPFVQHRLPQRLVHLLQATIAPLCCSSFKRSRRSAAAGAATPFARGTVRTDLYDHYVQYGPPSDSEVSRLARVSALLRIPKTGIEIPKQAASWPSSDS